MVGEARKRGGQAMRGRWVTVAGLGFLLVSGLPADAAMWSPAYVRRLPDTAFAVVETAREGKSVRHLPHHDATGRLDAPHLCNAVVRLNQVKWRDPANAKIARQHLQEHLAELGRSVCRPARKSTF
jgi:hypothetical protein